MSERQLWRMRIVFGKGEAVKYISHLDMLRAWERILRRAALPLAYSQGFNPHPRITIAMPSPVGCTGEGEVIDVVLYEPCAPEQISSSLEPVLPVGISVATIQEVPLKAPALPSLISGAVYHVTLADVSTAEAQRRVDGLLCQPTVQVEFRRKVFDLRPLIGSLALRRQGESTILKAALLRTPNGRIGRPDVLLQALGLKAYARGIHRARIVFARPQEGRHS